MDARPVGPVREGVTQVELDGEICVFSPAAGEVLFLNETAGDVWRMLDGVRTLEEISSMLAARYGLAPAAVTEDVAAVVRTFETSGLLAPGDAAQ